MKQSKRILLVFLQILCIAVLFLSIFILIPIPSYYEIQESNGGLTIIIELMRFAMVVVSYNTAVYINKLLDKKPLFDLFHYKIER